MQKPMKAKEDKVSEILAENEALRQQLAEAQETLRAIQHGEVDALVVSTPQGEQVYSITGAEKPYRVLIEEMKEGAVMLSEDNTIVYCNSGFAKIVKEPLDVLIGKSINGLVNPTHIALFSELLASGRKRGGVKEKEVGFRASDGTVVPAHVSVNASMKDEFRTTFLVIVDLTQHMQEEVKGYTADLEREIIQRKKAEEETARLASYPTLNPMPVVEVDFEGNISYLNPAAKAQFPTLKTTGKSHAFMSNWAVVTGTFKDKSVGTFSRDLEVYGRWYHQRFLLVPERNCIRIYTIDITERKKAEEELKSAQAKLEDYARGLERSS